MNKENFYNAVDILSDGSFGGTKYTTVKNGNTYDIYIFGACPALFERLVKAGYMLNEFHGIGTAVRVYKFEF